MADGASDQEFDDGGLGVTLPSGLEILTKPDGPRSDLRFLEKLANDGFEFPDDMFEAAIAVVGRIMVQSQKERHRLSAVSCFNSLVNSRVRAIVAYNGIVLGGRRGAEGTLPSASEQMGEGDVDPVAEAAEVLSDPEVMAKLEEVDRMIRDQHEGVVVVEESESESTDAPD